jgi:6-phosphogluconate dehydrogenase
MDYKVGIIGLGKMGSNIALNMKDHNIQVVGYNRSPEKTDTLEKKGIHGAYSIEELTNNLGSPKIIWLMVPAGKAVDENIIKLIPHLDEGDIIIDAGNSNFNDTLTRYSELKNKGIHFIDVGTSGGTDGARYGASMMVGGEAEVVASIDEVFKRVCVDGGYQYMGKPGAGHYVKMVHNGIEYGMMQAIAEGFEILDHSQFDLDYEKVARVWNNGAIISGYLMEMTENAFKHNDNQLTKIKPIIDHSGEGLWTAQEALKLGVSTPVIANALFARFQSKNEKKFGNKIVAAQRNEFGGHKLHQED